MSTTNLQAELRTATGHQVKSLRKEGRIPVTVYGKSVESASLSVNAEAFETTYETTGETGLIELVIGKDHRPVMIHHVQKHPLTGDILHVEFHQVNLKEKVTAPVPVELVGESPAIKDNLGTLLTLLDEVEIEALPADLPDHVDVDISHLTEVNQEITVSAIKVPASLKIITEADVAIVRIAAPVKEEAVPAAAPTDTAEGEAPAAAETPTPETEKATE